MDIEDRLLQGAIELHAHVFPEYSLKLHGRLHEIEWAELARAAGMRAIVMKSQVFPTVERANIVRRVVPGIEVFGGIVLNQTVGGLNPVAVEIAGELGGKIVWMPTWGSKSDISIRPAYLDTMKSYIKSMKQAISGPETGIEILEGGRLKPVAKEIVQIARDHRMAISSGHLSVRESILLVEECTKEGVPFILGHAFGRSVKASIEDQKEVAKRGGYIEHCFITTMPMYQRLELSKVVESIREVGPSQTILSTDAGQPWNPPHPEVMRMCIASFLHLQVEEGDIRKMIQENPSKILRLEDQTSGAAQ